MVHVAGEFDYQSLRLLALSIAVVADAQRRRGRGGFFNVRTPGQLKASTDASTSAGSPSPPAAWGMALAKLSVDYPRADINLSIRLSSSPRPRQYDAAGDPNYPVMQLTDPALFQCPFIMMTEVGRVYFSPEEAAKLRNTC